MMRTLAQLRNPVLPEPLGSSPDPQAGGIATGNFISSIVGLLFIIGFVWALLNIVTGGIAWISSEGDKANLEKARNKITHAIVGLIVVAAAWAIALLVGQFLGIDLRSLPIPNISDIPN